MTKTELARDPFELVNISVRLYKVQRELIDDAVALRAKTEPDYSLSDYIRETLTLQAAIDTGREPPELPDIQRGRGGSLVRQAAAKLGMSVEEFEQAAVRNMAAQTMGANALDDRPARVSSTIRPAARPGMYSSQPDSERVPHRKAR